MDENILVSPGKFNILAYTGLDFIVSQTTYILFIIL